VTFLKCFVFKGLLIRSDCPSFGLLLAAFLKIGLDNNPEVLSLKELMKKICLLIEAWFKFGQFWVMAWQPLPQLLYIRLRQLHQSFRTEQHHQ